MITLYAAIIIAGILAGSGSILFAFGLVFRSKHLWLGISFWVIAAIALALTNAFME